MNHPNVSACISSNDHLTNQKNFRHHAILSIIDSLIVSLCATMLDLIIGMNHLIDVCESPQLELRHGHSTRLALSPTPSQCYSKNQSTARRLMLKPKHSAKSECCSRCIPSLFGHPGCEHKTKLRWAENVIKTTSDRHKIEHISAFNCYLV